MRTKPSVTFSCAVVEKTNMVACRAHGVTNQVPPLENYNRVIPGAHRGSDPVGQWGLDANKRRSGQFLPATRKPNAGESTVQPAHPAYPRSYGYRVDEWSTLTYHELMRTAITHGMHAAPWADDRQLRMWCGSKTSVWTVEPGHIAPSRLRRRSGAAV